MYYFLDYSFEIFHCSLIAFNLLGWIWRRTRRLHLVVMSLTILSWTILGLEFGFGYCPCTDWHWRIKRRLGETDLPDSFVKYLADSVTGSDWNPLLIDTTVALAGILALAASLWLNWRDGRRAGSKPG